MSDVSKPINYGLWIPLVIFLISEAALAIWWAGSIEQRNRALRDEFEEYVDMDAARHLEQWRAINENDGAINQAIVQITATNASIEFIDRRFDELKEDLDELSDLLIQVIRQQQENSNGR